VTRRARTGIAGGIRLTNGSMTMGFSIGLVFKIERVFREVFP
jgi:hypothetical protein